LTVILSQEEIEAIWAAVENEPTTLVTVDLVERQVRWGSEIANFEIDDYTRWRLLEGLDDIGLTLRHVEAVDTFEKMRPNFKPKTLPAKI
jgi:3-isopropylmalate/(R)-2-methylmalate dehydratase small subunit